MQCCPNNLVKISSNFTDKELIFDDLSVSKTHFTDKTAFPGNLSVNF
ncbi:MAG: prevent-host-death protein [Lactobacillus ruminis]|nr:prevent-host-death protein [Ligilactobacillus ruminis]